MSQIDLFLRSSARWTVVGGTLVLREPFAAASVAGASLLLASLAVIAERPRRLRFSGPQRLALGAAVAFGAGDVILVAQVRLVLLMAMGVLLRERDRLPAKLAAAAVMLAGIAALASGVAA